MRHKKKVINKEQKTVMVELNDITPEQGSEIGKRIKALQDEREEKKKRAKELEEVKVLNSDKAGQPVGFIAPEDDIENLLTNL